MPRIRRPVVVEILVGQFQRGLGPEQDRRRRIDAPAPQIDVVTIGATILEHSVEAEEHAVRDPVADIHGHPFIEILATLKDDFPNRSSGGVLEHAIDDAPAAAATEDHCVRSLEHFDPLDVVEIAVVHRVVAHAVDVEIGAGLLPADHDLVPVAGTLVQEHAGHVAQGFGDSLEPLILDLLARHDRHRLRGVDQLGVRLRRAPAAVGAVACSMSPCSLDIELV